MVTRAAAASLGTPPRPAAGSFTGAPGRAGPPVHPNPLRVSRSRFGPWSVRFPPPLDQPKASTTMLVSTWEKRHTAPADSGTKVKAGTISPARKLTVDANGRAPH